MILIMTHASGFSFGLAETPQEIIAARALRLAVFKKAGFYPPHLEDDTDCFDDQDPFLFIIKQGDEVVGHTRYVRGGTGLGIFDAFDLTLPPDVAAIPEIRMLDGGKTAVVARMPGALTSGGLLAAVSLYLHWEAQYDVSLHCTFKQWAQRVHTTGLPYKAFDEYRIIYPRDGIMNNYYYPQDPEKRVAPYYAMVKDAAEPALRLAFAMEMEVEQTFR